MTYVTCEVATSEVATRLAVSVSSPYDYILRDDFSVERLFERVER